MDGLAIEQDVGRCWGCGYLLRGVESAVCPECGRPFDRDDRRTMNFGLPMGPVARWAVAEWSRWPVVLVVVGVFLILAVTRIPPDGWKFSFVDVRFYGPMHEWRKRDAPPTGVDAVYTAGLLASAFAAAWCLLRLIARGWAVVRFRPPTFQRGRVVRRTLLVAILVSVAMAGVGVGWPDRLAQRWIANVDRPSRVVISISALPSYPTAAAVVPLPLSPEQETAVLRAALRSGGTRQRIAGLRLLTGTRSAAEAAALLAPALAAEPDGEVRAVEARLLAFTGVPERQGILRRLLADPDARVREAAIDGLGIPYDSSSFVGLTTPAPLRFATDPVIEVPGAWRWTTGAPIDPTDHGRLTTIMTASPTTTLAEREAAARVLVNTPPREYDLRYAEWAVYDDRPATTDPPPLDVPDFAYRIGVPSRERMASAKRRRTWTSVVQLSADRPMAVDLQLLIAGGWPQAAYPKFDDFALSIDYSRLAGAGKDADTAAVIDAFDPRGLTFFNQLRDGPAWLRSSSGLTPSGRIMIQQMLEPWSNRMDGIGVRWMGLIVSPDRIDGMTPPAIDPASAGSPVWNHLRASSGVSWLSARGEYDRFLTYAGPTGRRPPLSATLDAANRLHWTTDAAYAYYAWYTGPRRRALFVDVGPAGVAARWLDDPYRDGEVDVSSLAARTGESVEAEFQGALEDMGLLPREAGELLEARRASFFRTPGRRLLTLLSMTDYDQACPVRIRPRPTKQVRVGVAVAEITK